VTIQSVFDNIAGSDFEQRRFAALARRAPGRDSPA
jgi:hypothetical protein